ncbi:MlaD family protein [Nocardia seriolae]|uniref:MlaD family protein n=1 Tax=Nocardia seriolae TaxID=37332 RepID=UPI00068A6761|nr:MlaD family protein [Nocardia seriolae]MTJ64482.1 mammalian cell entry protein [Nocardia seriolae]MTJ74742.1 mammalian cell entry protein [Nocardia seriolae]MTJ87526.1 mammalian cell entry protein [Nocardia seriolae]MTK31517.1 mammalian cell entry protein [Nocardia seriolae]MTK42354.1 mammalian cell entry protein [Nocardia seriolae]
MPDYALPGTEVGPRRARVLGACALVLSLLTVIGWRAWPETTAPDDLHVALLVGKGGAGVAPGTDVRLDGVRVGTVTDIDARGVGRARITMDLNGSQLFGLTDALGLDYAPGNLFGISSVELRSGTGGSALVDGATVDLTGDSGRVRDATLAALLQSTGTLTDRVLTPELVELLRRFAHDLDGFVPLLQAIGATARSFAETQQLPPSLLFDRYGSALTGLPPMLTGGMAVLWASYANEHLKTDEQVRRYGEMFDRVRGELLPVATGMLGTSQRYFQGLMPMGSVILDRLSASVSTPERSAQQLTELLTRLGEAFHDTPDGPVLDATVELVPALAQPLSAQLGLATGGGPR